ncbi:hypothetical protein [Acinetobacter sp. WU_MDCI_Abxc222]|uniref:hypothetical protein n=1 Tax=Acinetobacter sp. WU_MDCI_Abxc222 TaxID=2850076 RepID=UPI0021CD872C|nr:hypothetical protein [Acinetobacter sp. WU_MDCI_Abxc222]
MLMKSLEVVAAVIQHQDKVLCALKGEHKYPYLSNKYEFPGGKVNDEIKSLNQKAYENKEKLPYFVAFKIPVEQSIDHIDIFDPMKNIQ